MKLAAIYNVWDGVELLRGSMLCLKDHVDLFIIVYQEESNFGEKYNPIEDIELSGFKVVLVPYVPNKGGGFLNESAKRNIGLDYAKTYNCTHFIHMDCDEYYEDFGLAKQEYLSKNPQGGSVCKMFTYFKKPTLRFETEDNYHVPFIHKLEADTKAGVRLYPFYVDPTRRINSGDVVEISSRMHHFSWVRKDIERKARNSTAKANIERSQLLKDYHSAEIKAGSYVVDFRQKLIEVENKFNIEI